MLLLQHPRERRMPVGTARMAHLSLPGSILRSALDFSNDDLVQRAIRGPGPAYVLFPGPQSLPVQSLPQQGPLTLVVLDGTWSQARKLLTLNPWLQTLPRVGFTPRTASAYQIRQQPAPGCVSTIEALAEILSYVEPDGGRFERLLDPFVEMVDRQLRFETEVATTRHSRKRRRSTRVSLGQTLSSFGTRLLMVQGEANAWPTRAIDRPPPEVVHWTAAGADGRAFDAIMAPAYPLGPSVARYIELSADRLKAGEDPIAAQGRWTAFRRPDDVVLVWGTYHLGLVRRAGWPLPETVLDLRNLLSQERRQHLGDVENTAAALFPGHACVNTVGRGRRRLGALQTLVNGLMGADEIP